MIYVDLCRFFYSNLKSHLGFGSVARDNLYYHLCLGTVGVLILPVAAVDAPDMLSDTALKILILGKLSVDRLL